MKLKVEANTSLASNTVPTPTVNAICGTLLISPPKNLAFAIMVSFARVFTLVRETREEPGSLNAICPSGPIPKKKSKIEFCTLLLILETWKVDRLKIINL